MYMYIYIYTYIYTCIYIYNYIYVYVKNQKYYIIYIYIYYVDLRCLIDNVPYLATNPSFHFVQEVQHDISSAGFLRPFPPSITQQSPIWAQFPRMWCPMIS